MSFPFELNILPVEGINDEHELGTLAPEGNTSRKVVAYRVDGTGVDPLNPGTTDITILAAVECDSTPKPTATFNGSSNVTLSISNLIYDADGSQELVITAATTFSAWTIVVTAIDGDGNDVAQPLLLRGTTSRVLINTDLDCHTSTTSNGGCVTSVFQIGDATNNTAHHTPLYVQNLLPQPIYVKCISSLHGLARLEYYVPECNKSRVVPAAIQIDANSSAELRIVPSTTLNTCDIGRHVKEVSIYTNTDALSMNTSDMQIVPVHLEILDDLSYEGHALAKQMSTYEMLTSRVRIGAASLFYDDLRRQLRVKVGNKEQSLTGMRGEKGEKGDVGDKGFQGERGEKGDDGDVNPKTNLYVCDDTGFEYVFGDLGGYLTDESNTIFYTTVTHGGPFVVDGIAYTTKATRIDDDTEILYGEKGKAIWVSASRVDTPLTPASLTRDASGGGPYVFEYDTYYFENDAKMVRAKHIVSGAVYFEIEDGVWDDAANPGQGNTILLMHAAFRYSQEHGFELKLPRGPKGDVGTATVGKSVDTVERQSESHTDSAHETLLRVVTDSSGQSDLEIVNGTRDADGTFLNLDTMMKIFSDGTIRIKSGVFISQNPMIRGTNEFSLNVVTRENGLTELAVLDVNGDPQFNVTEYAPDISVYDLSGHLYDNPNGTGGRYTRTRDLSRIMDASGVVFMHDGGNNSGYVMSGEDPSAYT